MDVVPSVIDVVISTIDVVLSVVYLLSTVVGVVLEDVVPSVVDAVVETVVEAVFEAISVFDSEVSAKVLVSDQTTEVWELVKDTVSVLTDVVAIAEAVVAPSEVVMDKAVVVIKGDGQLLQVRRETNRFKKTPPVDQAALGDTNTRLPILNRDKDPPGR